MVESKTRFTSGLEPIVRNISQIFVGKELVVRNAVLALASGGHVLLEDVPGVGKTLLAKALARSVSAEFRRIQFTADLLPSDITGTTIYSQRTQEFLFRPGPVFTNILLADEINRATPRTQSSLLEAMEEEHVTIEGELHPLPAPFFVIATQNPVELEGTYPLPFAQMDRFILRSSIGYLDRESELGMLKAQRSQEVLESVMPVTETVELIRLQNLVRQVKITDPLLGYLLDIVRATRNCEGVEFGASPRGSLDLQRFSQALAFWGGRDYVLPDDVKEAAKAVLPHRLIVRKGLRTATVTDRGYIDQILERLPVPV